MAAAARYLNACPVSPAVRSTSDRLSRWLEVSIGCTCGAAVSVRSACAQPGDDDDRVWVSAGDPWRCEAGHVGHVLLHDGHAWLGRPLEVGSVEDVERWGGEGSGRSAPLVGSVAPAAQDQGERVSVTAARRVIVGVDLRDALLDAYRAWSALLTDHEVVHDREDLDRARDRVRELETLVARQERGLPSEAAKAAPPAAEVGAPRPALALEWEKAGQTWLGRHQGQPASEVWYVAFDQHWCWRASWGGRVSRGMEDNAIEARSAAERWLYAGGAR